MHKSAAEFMERKRVRLNNGWEECYGTYNRGGGRMLMPAPPPGQIMKLAPQVYTTF